MKTIKVFIASSEELKEERVLMASLANELSTRLEKVGIQVIAVEWESLDASMNEEHKQEEYNEKLRECDMCMVLYWTKFGMYTKTELDTAYNQKIAGKNPQKVWAYFKEKGNPDKEPTKELKEFRDSFPTKYGHFYSPFANFDTLKAHFLLQFMEYQSQALEGKSIVEVKDGKVSIDGKEYVDLQNVPFAGNNEEYNTIKKSISDKQNLLQFVPTDNPLYSQTAEELRQLKEKLAKMESSLWDTALMITRLSTTKCSERLQRAMDLFNQGDNKGAQAILNEEEIEKDVQHNLNLIKLGEEGKKGLKTNIDEYLLKIRTYENEMEEGWLQKRCELCDRVLQLSISLYGENAEKTADAYDKLGSAYSDGGDYYQALEHHQMALVLRENILDKEHPDIALSYNRIGIEYYHLADYDKALECYRQALNIWASKLGIEHPQTAAAYTNTGNVYLKMANNEKALAFYEKAMSIYEKVLGEEHPSTAHIRFNIGLIYEESEEYAKALEYYKKAMDILKKVLGNEHPDTTKVYNQIGKVYNNLGNYDKALEYHKQALAIREKKLGKEHPDTADSYSDIGYVYKNLGNYDKALEYHKQALAIRENKLGKDDLDTSSSYNGIGLVYDHLGDYDKALEYHMRALDIRVNKLGKKHPQTAKSYNIIGSIYNSLSDCSKAFEWYLRSAEQNNAMGQYNLAMMLLNGKGVKQNYKEAFNWFFKAAMQNDDDAEFYLGWMYQYGKGVEQDYSKAIEWYQKAAIHGNSYAQTNLGFMYENGFGVDKNYSLALEWYQKAAKINNPTALHNIGNLYDNGKGVEKDYIKATEWYRKAIEQGYTNSYNDLAWTYHLMGKYDDALPWAEKAVAAFPDNPNIIDTMATVYQGLGRYDEAMEQFELCLKLYKEQENSEGIQETEEKIATLKELMKKEG